MISQYKTRRTSHVIWQCQRSAKCLKTASVLQGTSWTIHIVYGISQIKMFLGADEALRRSTCMWPTVHLYGEDTQHVCLLMKRSLRESHDRFLARNMRRTRSDHLSNIKRRFSVPQGPLNTNICLRGGARRRRIETPMLIFSSFGIRRSRDTT